MIIDPEYHHETINVEVQQNNPHSLLWWMKRMIALRKHYRAFGRGSMNFLYPENHKILAFVREYKEEKILVVANLSRYVQYAELDLSRFKDLVPVELFGMTDFPRISEEPYFLNLGPHSFYWFSIEPAREKIYLQSRPEQDKDIVEVTGKWENIFHGTSLVALETHLPSYLRYCRWFGSAGYQIKSAWIRDRVVLRDADRNFMLALVEVDYVGRDKELYLLPLCYLEGREAALLMKKYPGAGVIRLHLSESRNPGLLCDAIFVRGFHRALFQGFSSVRTVKTEQGNLRFLVEKKIAALKRDVPPESSPWQGERDETIIYFDKLASLKCFRRLETGENPDLELRRQLTRRGFPNILPVLGSLEFDRGRAERMTLGILQQSEPYQENAWDLTMHHLGDFFERALATNGSMDLLPPVHGSAMDLTSDEAPPALNEMIGGYLDSVRLIGHRTGQLHLALANASQEKPFAPEPFSKLYRRSMYQSMRSLMLQTFKSMRASLRLLPDSTAEQIREILNLRQEILESFSELIETPIRSQRIRIHGDYHLGRLLFTGKDFVIVDFEGEAKRTLSERLIKRSAVRDAAGMLRSFDYAVRSKLLQDRTISDKELAALEPWVRQWQFYVEGFFLRSYLWTIRDTGLAPENSAHLEVLLRNLLLEKAIYELGYELENRPHWVTIPARGIKTILASARRKQNGNGEKV